MKVIVGFTGTQHGMTDQQKFQLQRELTRRQVSSFHHGDCIGADAEAHSVAEFLNLPIEIHPTTGSKRAFCSGAIKIHQSLPPLVRNTHIVNASHILIAAPRQRVEVLRSGTWATIRYARKTGKEVIYLWP